MPQITTCMLMNMFDKCVCVFKAFKIVIVITNLLLSAKVSQIKYPKATFSHQTFCVITIPQYNIDKYEISGSFLFLEEIHIKYGYGFIGT